MIKKRDDIMKYYLQCSHLTENQVCSFYLKK